MKCKWIPGEPPKDGETYLVHIPASKGYVARQDIVPVHWCNWGGGVWEDSVSGHKVFSEISHYMKLPDEPDK